MRSNNACLSFLHLLVESPDDESATDSHLSQPLAASEYDFRSSRKSMVISCQLVQSDRRIYLSSNILSNVLYLPKISLCRFKLRRKCGVVSANGYIDTR